MTKKSYFIIAATLFFLLALIFLVSSQTSQSKREVYDAYQESKDNLAQFITSIAPQNAKTVTVFVGTHSKDNDQFYYTQSLLRNGETQPFDITPEQIKKLFILVSDFRGGNLVDSPYRPYDIEQRNRFTLDLDSKDLQHGTFIARTPNHLLPSYITTKEMYDLDEKMQRSNDQFFRGIGIRFEGASQQTLVLMYNIKAHSTYLRLMNESEAIQRYIDSTQCEFAKRVEKTGGHVAFEYYYENLYEPVNYFTISLDKCH